ATLCLILPLSLQADPAEESCKKAVKLIQESVDKCKDESYCPQLKMAATASPPEPCTVSTLKEQLPKLAQCLSQKKPTCAIAVMEQMKKENMMSTVKPKV